RLHEPVSRDWIVNRLACPVLFTTRRHAPSGCKPVPLTVLPEDVALLLLLRHRPHMLEPEHPEHETAQAICYSLGYLPLALEIASAHLGLLPNAPLHQYQAELRQRGMLTVLGDERALVKTRHETGLQAVLSGQWQQLPSEEARQLLRVAGQLPEAAQISAARLGLLAGVPEEGQSFFDVTLNTALSQLIDASLLESLGDDLVRLHPLVQDFAQHQVPQAEHETFRHQCALRLADALEDFTILEKQCARRGVDAVQEDLLATLALIEVDKPAIVGKPIGIPPWRYTLPIKGKVKASFSARLINVLEIATPRLQLLLRLLQLEIHTLRNWQPEQQPALFAQQMAYRAHIVGLEEMLFRIVANLRKKNIPFVLPKWMHRQESFALERTLSGHFSFVNAVAVTPDGRRAVSASGDRTLKVWNLVTGAEERCLIGHSDSVSAVAVTPDGRWAVSASMDGTLNVWNLETGEVKQTMIGHFSPVWAVAVAPTRRQAVSADRDGMLIVWNLDTGMVERMMSGHSDDVLAVVVTPDGKRVVSASSDQTLKVWNLVTGEEERTLNGHSTSVFSVAVTPDVQWVISASSDDTLKVWNLEAGKADRTLSGRSASISRVAITSDGQQVVAFFEDDTLKVWNLTTGENEALSGHLYSESRVLTSDGRLFMLTGGDSSKMWNLKTGEKGGALSKHLDWLRVAVVTPDGRRAVTASDDRTLIMWNLETGQAEWTLNMHPAFLQAMAVSPDGRQLVSLSDHKLKVLNIETGNLLATIELDGILRSVSWANDGVSIVTVDAVGNVYCMQYIEPNVSQ
ncbi:MAG: hypothetical protein KC496_17665, partial [Anaerolineae bacterium]|nr:hypothetical protein [Anaerolineae bacterium]